MYQMKASYSSAMSSSSSPGLNDSSENRKVNSNCNDTFWSVSYHFWHLKGLVPPKIKLYYYLLKNFVNLQDKNEDVLIKTDSS